MRSSRRKPKNLYINTFEGIDTVGKTFLLNTLRQSSHKGMFIQQMSNVAMNSLLNKYPHPFELEGTPLYDEYQSFQVMHAKNSLEYYEEERALSEQDFYSVQHFDFFWKLYLTLPHRNVPSYNSIKSILEGNPNTLSKRMETRFKLFVINYHEAMDYVWKFMKERGKQQSYVLYTDRSWISNFIYNETTQLLEDDEQLLTRIRGACYHKIDFVTLYITNEQALKERLELKASEGHSIYEKYGTHHLMKKQEKYLYLVHKLHRLGYIKNYQVLEKGVYLPFIN